MTACRNFRSRPVCVLLAMLLIAACHPGRPNYIIDEDDMEEILYDYHLAQALADVRRDSVDYYRYAYVQKVFEKHDVTEQEFDSSMVWYAANADVLFKVYVRLHDRLAAEAAAAGLDDSESEYASLTSEGDSANIWSGAKMIVLTQATNVNHLTFTYRADSTFLAGDEFIFNAGTFFLQRDGQREALAALTLRYEGDSVVSEVQSLHGDQEIEVRIRADKEHELKEVGGFVFYPTSENRDKYARRLFVLNPVLVRIHH